MKGPFRKMLVLAIQVEFQGMGDPALRKPPCVPEPHGEYMLIRIQQLGEGLAIVDRGRLIIVSSPEAEVLKDTVFHAEPRDQDIPERLSGRLAAIREIIFRPPCKRDLQGPEPF
jgi:hypothetical protein